MALMKSFQKYQHKFFSRSQFFSSSLHKNSLWSTIKKKYSKFFFFTKKSVKFTYQQWSICVGLRRMLVRDILGWLDFVAVFVWPNLWLLRLCDMSYWGAHHLHPQRIPLPFFVFFRVFFLFLLNKTFDEFAHALKRAQKCGKKSLEIFFVYRCKENCSKNTFQLQCSCFLCLWFIVAGKHKNSIFTGKCSFDDLKKNIIDSYRKIWCSTRS